VLVSEVMLQQTQAARVAPRWTAWVARWPTAASLASASPAEVLGAWVGLGYNRRALRLREACAIVARDGWPEDLTVLPGVGPYTAAAVASFAFGKDVAAVDTNVRRVCARLGRGSPDELLPPGEAAAFNQAMMDLGATVCRARNPRCRDCPVAGWCASRGRVEAPPRRQADGRAPFEATSRWARGRVVASLAAGEGLPVDVPAARLRDALAGLERDGIVVLGADGAPRFPDFRDTLL
jgi:A/G-specific adenine glycosylase